MDSMITAAARALAAGDPSTIELRPSAIRQIAFRRDGRCTACHFRLVAFLGRDAVATGLLTHEPEGI